jgi:hypothetical protein
VYDFFVHLRHPTYRLVTRAGVPFPTGSMPGEWRHTRTREADDVNAEVRDAVAQHGYSLFRIGLSFADIPQD